MHRWRWTMMLSAALAAVSLTGLGAARLAAQQPVPPPAVLGKPLPGNMSLTLDEAKQRALSNNKLLQLAGMNVQAKGYAIKAARANYFPMVSGTAMYMHFDQNLGTVLSTQGRTLVGPLGRPLATIPRVTVEAAVVNQDSTIFQIGAVQPLTDLLKVRQGVKIAQADQGIAQAQLEKGMREVASGVEQLFWGLLAARRIRAGAEEGLKGAEMLAKTGVLEARLALVEARQALQQIDKQIADLQEQLNGLLDQPLCTVLELVEPPLPTVPVGCADDAVGLALAFSPEVHEAQQTIAKARAAVCAGKLDYVPSIAAVAGFANQSAADYIQPDIGYVGLVGTYTIVDWGKRRNVIHERQTLLSMATLKLAQTEDDIRQKTVKAFRELAQSQEALQTAQELVGLRKQAEKKAMTPEAMRNPAALLLASKARMEAEVEAIKADLAYRQAHVQLLSLITQP